MHNQLLAYDAFKDDMNVFTFKEEDENSIGQYTSTDDTSSGLWIIIKFYRDVRFSKYSDSRYTYDCIQCI